MQAALLVSLMKRQLPPFWQVMFVQAGLISTKLKKMQEIIFATNFGHALLLFSKNFQKISPLKKYETCIE